MKLTNNIPNIKLFKLLLVICIACPGLLCAQLYVKGNAELTVKSSLTSKQTDNIFESTVGGQGELNFNATDQQNITTVKDISVPAINIYNVAVFTISKDVVIKGNLNLINSGLYLDGHLYVEEYLTLKEESCVFGIEFLIENYKNQNKHWEANALTNSKHNVPVLFVTNLETRNNIKIIEFLDVEQSIYKNAFYDNNRRKPVTPPPKLFLV